MDAMIRQLGMITPAQQEMIRSTTVAFAGLNSIGAMAALMCAKAGFGQLILYGDTDYMAHHISTQVFANRETIESPKTAVARRELEKHTRFCQIDTVKLSIGSLEEAGQISSATDFIIADSNDVIELLYIDHEAEKKKIPILISNTFDWTAMSATYMPDSFRFKDIFTSFSGFENGKIKDPETVDLEWRIFRICLGRCSTGVMETILRNGMARSEDLAPHSCFVASIAVNELIKLTTNLGKSMVAPDAFGFNLLATERVDIRSFETNRRQILRAYHQHGIQGAIEAYKKVY